MSGFNVHSVIRNVISWAHPDETVTVIRATNKLEKNERGRQITRYIVEEDVRAQVQAESDAALFHSDHVGQNTQTMRFYLMSPKKAKKQVSPLDRSLMRSGDFIYRNDYDTWWMVDAVVDQYSRSGWKSVRATLQPRVPPEVEEALPHAEDSCCCTE